MTAQELIEMLESFDPDTEVRFASQPAWPFEYSIEDMATNSEDNIVYLSEGSQIGYLPSEISEQLGW